MNSARLRKSRRHAKSSRRRNPKPASQRSITDQPLGIERLEPRVVLTASADLVPLTLLDQSDYLAQYDTAAEQEAFVRSRLAQSPDTAWLQDGNSNLRLVETKFGLAGIYNRFVQTLDGIDVYDSWVTVNQRADGSIQEVFNSGYEKVQLTELPVMRAVPFMQAEQTALGNVGASETFAPSQGELVWFVDENGVANKAWQLTVYAADPLGDFLTVVDVESREVILQENRISHATGSGDVFVPNPYQTQGSGTGIADNGDANSAALTAQLVNVTLLGLDNGTGLIRGEFVDLSTLNSTSLPDVDANEISRVYNYDRDDPRFEQVVIYQSVDSINRYFHLLGFDDDTGVANGIRDFATLANAHWYSADQSFYSTGDDAIHFGDGGVDDGEDADIIAHEYGHAIQHNQNASWGGGEMGAMGEAFGDYLAAAFYEGDGDPTFQSLHAACVGEWDATSYSGSNPPCLRRVDGNKTYPDDLVGQVHADGEIWSRALWDIRAALGGTVADQIILEHHFGLPGGATMPVAANWMLQVDQTLNGGANQVAIRQAFIDRGILQPLPTEGSLDLDQDSYNPVDVINIEVVDSNAIAPVIVSIESDTGDTEQVTLTDQGNGLYTGSINTTTGAAASDGQLQVALGDEVRAEYNDPDDGTGSPFLATDNAFIANVAKYSSGNVNQTIEAGPHLSTITVTDGGTIADLNVEIDADHTYAADLDVFLIAPDGTRIELFSDVGGSGNDFNNTVLDDEAATAITAGTAPFAGSFRPEGSLAVVDGMDITGDWTLEITDDFPFDVDNGVLHSWALCFEVIPDEVLINPDGTKFLDGVPISGTLADAVFSDDSYYSIDPSPTTNPLKQQVDILLLAQYTGGGTPTLFEFTLEASMNGGPAGDVIQTIEVFNFNTNLFEVVATQAATTSDSSVTIAVGGTLSDYLDPGSSEVITRVSWASPVFSGATFNWSIDVDQWGWSIS